MHAPLRSLRPALFAVAAALLPGANAAAQRAPAVTAVELGDDGRSVTLEIAWANAFRTERNHDAAWLILRAPGDARAAPLRLVAAGHAALGEPSPPVELTVPDDRLGLFVAAARPHRGDVRWRLQLRLDAATDAAPEAWAVGMVHVPAGGFELGSDDALALRFGAFHRRPDDGGEPTVYRIDDEAALRVADEPGALWYQPDRNGYHGDGAGPIPAAFPKGTRAFYVMRHELTQGFYARWLSALPPEWQELRAPLDIDDAERASCTIRRDDDAPDRWLADAPERPCNFVSWDDTAALIDWLALRPMTEFEFEKAARGPTRPVPCDYPWGTADDTGLQRVVRPNRDLAFASAADEAGLTHATRPVHGASFYLVMDLSGSLWERVVSAGRPEGRRFRGSHGDGVLDDGARASNDDWPRTHADDEAPGIGYRGGAEYFAPRKADNPTNPHSPVAWRTYGGWGGAQRYKTYSARACRTAPIR